MCSAIDVDYLPPVFVEDAEQLLERIGSDESIQIFGGREQRIEDAQLLLQSGVGVFPLGVLGQLVQLAELALEGFDRFPGGGVLDGMDVCRALF